MNNYTVYKAVQTSVEISIWNSFRASMWDTLSNSTSYAVRFNTQRDIGVATLDASARVPVLKVSAWAAAANATRDYFGQK
jgi:hypothetical protein